MTDSPTDKALKGKLRSVGGASRFMRAHYLELEEASTTGERKVAWCSSVGPAELLRAMGFLVYFPENHAAMLGASRRAGEVMTAANRLGYSPAVCAYLRADIGAYLNGETPLSTISATLSAPPKPDVLVYNTNQCRDIKDWFCWYAERLRVPCVGVEGHRNVDRVTSDHVRAISAQLRALVPLLTAIIGRPLDTDALEKTVALSKSCSDAWGGLLSRAAHRPSPLSFFNGLLLMGPAVVGRGTEAAVAFPSLIKYFFIFLIVDFTIDHLLFTLQNEVN